MLRIASEQSEKQEIYKLILDSKQDVIFIADSTVSDELAITREGDRVTLEYVETGDGVIHAVSFDNLEFTQKQAENG